MFFLFGLRWTIPSCSGASSLTPHVRQELQAQLLRIYEVEAGGKEDALQQRLVEKKVQDCEGPKSLPPDAKQPPP